jgi:ribosomal protein L20A (L18A)
MSKTFKYIQNEDVLRTFREYQGTILSERPVVIARHGDYDLLLEKLSEDTLGLRIMNTEKNFVVQSRSYDINKTTDALVARGVRHACQKMFELNDEEVNRRRMQIWKWYILDWQKANADKTDELMSRELTWSEETFDVELLDMEAFLHGDYLNLGNTLGLIDKHLMDEKQREKFRNFAIADIMEMTSEDTKDRSIAEAEKASQDVKMHTYQFTVSVEATDKEHARQALLRYLAGDERIKVQK